MKKILIFFSLLLCLSIQMALFLVRLTWAYNQTEARWLFVLTRENLSPEKICNEDGGDSSGEVGKKGVAGRIACFHHAYRTEIDSENVKGRIGAPSYDGGQSTYKCIRSFCFHHIKHHRATTATA